MPHDKVLNKLQLQIADILNNLENFTDNTVQPSVDECIKLQKQLCEIQEQLAIYKFQKSDKEISPSFHIHAKVSEVEQIIPEQKNSTFEKTNANESPVNIVNEISKEEKEIVMETIKQENKSSSLKVLTVAINDKFRFINELFLHNAAEYNIAVEQINNLNDWNDCELYLNSLKSLYNWKEQNETVKQFFAVVKKRFE